MATARKLRLRDFLGPGHACHFAVTDVCWPDPQNMHAHDFMELFWIESGRGWHWINGQRRELVERRLALVRADDQHAFSASDGRAMRLANFAFATAMWREIRRQYGEGTADAFSPKEAAKR